MRSTYLLALTGLSMFAIVACGDDASSSTDSGTAADANSDAGVMTDMNVKIDLGAAEDLARRAISAQRT